MKNNNPLITIVVPIYNVEKYLIKCLDSIIGQTYENTEIILVDDGSTDSSGKMADTYNKYENVKVIHKQNGGLSSARNLGIQKAHGEWIAFIDSDDYLECNFISRLSEIAKDASADIATCNFQSFTNDNCIPKKSPVWPEKALSGYEAINDMQARRLPAYICLSLFRLELFLKNNIRFPEGQKYEDISTRIKLLYYANKVAFTNERLYHYLVRHESITGKQFTKTEYEDIQKSVDDVKKFLVESKHSTNFIYVDYFELCSLIGILNNIVRTSSKTDKETKEIWKNVRNQLKTLFRTTSFPTKKSRIIFKILISLSRNRTIYSIIYHSVK